MIGNGLKKDFFHKFTTRFNIPQIGEFYASTEGNVGFINTHNYPGSCGFNPLLIGLSHPLLKVDPLTGEVLRDQNGLCIRCDAGEPGLLVGKILNIGLQKFTGYHNEDETKKKILCDVLKKGTFFISFNVNYFIIICHYVCNPFINIFLIHHCCNSSYDLLTHLLGEQVL